MESEEREDNATAHVELGVLEYGHDDSQMRTHYRGQMLGEKRQGLGVLKYSNNALYEGEWNDDKAHGFGCETMSSGEVYRGQFVLGQRAKKGVLYNLDGTVFAGNWSEGKLNGIGVVSRVRGDGVTIGSKAVRFEEGKIAERVAMSGQDVSALLAEFGHGEEDAREIAEAARRTDLEVQDLVRETAIQTRAGRHGRPGVEGGIGDEDSDDDVIDIDASAYSPSRAAATGGLGVEGEAPKRVIRAPATAPPPCSKTDSAMPDTAGKEGNFSPGGERGGEGKKQQRILPGVASPAKGNQNGSLRDGARPQVEKGDPSAGAVKKKGVSSAGGGGDSKGTSARGGIRVDRSIGSSAASSKPRTVVTVIDTLAGGHDSVGKGAGRPAKFPRQMLKSGKQRPAVSPPEISPRRGGKPASVLPYLRGAKPPQGKLGGMEWKSHGGDARKREGGSRSSRGNSSSNKSSTRDVGERIGGGSAGKSAADKGASVGASEQPPPGPGAETALVAVAAEPRRPGGVKGLVSRVRGTIKSGERKMAASGKSTLSRTGQSTGGATSFAGNLNKATLPAYASARIGSRSTLGGARSVSPMTKGRRGATGEMTSEAMGRSGASSSMSKAAPGSRGGVPPRSKSVPPGAKRRTAGSSVTPGRSGNAPKSVSVRVYSKRQPTKTSNTAGTVAGVGGAGGGRYAGLEPDLDKWYVKRSVTAIPPSTALKRVLAQQAMIRAMHDDRQKRKRAADARKREEARLLQAEMERQREEEEVVAQAKKRHAAAMMMAPSLAPDDDDDDDDDDDGNNSVDLSFKSNWSASSPVNEAAVSGGGVVKSSSPRRVSIVYNGGASRRTSTWSRVGKSPRRDSHRAPPKPVVELGVDADENGEVVQTIADAIAKENSAAFADDSQYVKNVKQKYDKAHEETPSWVFLPQRQNEQGGKKSLASMLGFKSRGGFSLDQN